MALDGTIPVSSSPGRGKQKVTSSSCASDAGQLQAASASLCSLFPGPAAPHLHSLPVMPLSLVFCLSVRFHLSNSHSMVSP